MRKVALGELVRSTGRRAGRNIDLPVYSVTKHAGFVPSLEYFKKQVFSRNVEGYKLVEPGDFAYATIHLDEGSIGIAPERGLISPMYTVFQIDPSLIDSGYLIRFLKSPQALAHYPGLGKGAIHRRKAISLAALSTLSIPLPPLREQRRVTEILDLADAIRAKRRQVLADLDTLGRSALNSFLTMDCQRVPFGELILEGPKNGLYRPSSEYGSGTPIVRIDSFRFSSRIIETTTLKRLRASESQLKEFALSTGDLLVNRVNSRKHVGKTALVGTLSEPTVFESNMMRIRVDQSQVLPLYLAEFMQTRDVRAQLDPMIKDAVNQSSINQRDVRSISLPLPAIEAQYQFAARIEGIDRHRAIVRAALAADEELFDSLQSRAFRGEL